MLKKKKKKKTFEGRETVTSREEVRGEGGGNEGTERGKRERATEIYIERGV